MNFEAQGFSHDGQYSESNGKGAAHFDTCGAPEYSGNGTSSRRIFAKVAFRFLPLKGVVPKSISYTNIPSVHQSTALV